MSTVVANFKPLMTAGKGKNQMNIPVSNAGQVAQSAPDYSSSMVGLAMDTNMKAPLCARTLENAAKTYPGIYGAIIHSDRGSQCTRQIYRDVIRKMAYGRA